MGEGQDYQSSASICFLVAAILGVSWMLIMAAVYGYHAWLNITGGGGSS